MNIRLQLKSNFTQVNDPILQRPEKYVKKIIKNLFKKKKPKENKVTQNLPKNHHCLTTEQDVYKLILIIFKNKNK